MPTVRQVVLPALLISGAAGIAAAQPGRPIGPPTMRPSARPTTSPYLNLADDAEIRSPAFQYFRRVRPENEFRREYARQSNAIRTLQEQLEDQRAMSQSPESALGPTGHRTSFMNYGNYYPAARGGR